MYKSLLAVLIGSILFSPLSLAESEQNKSDSAPEERKSATQPKEKIILDEDEDELALSQLANSENRFEAGSVLLIPQLELKVGGDWQQRADDEEANGNNVYDNQGNQDFINKSYINVRTYLESDKLFGLGQLRFNTNNSNKTLNSAQDQFSVTYAYIGYDFDAFGKVSGGTLKPGMSHIKNISVTPGFNINSKAAGNADSSIKYENSYNNFSLKVSYSENYEFSELCDSNDGDIQNCKESVPAVDLYSGHVMFNNGTLLLAAGYEERSNDSNIYTGGGILTLGSVKLGANYFQQEIHGLKDDGAPKTTRSRGGSFTGRYTINRSLYLSGGYSYEDFYGDEVNDGTGDGQFATVGGQYKFSKAANVKFAYQKGLNSFTRDKFYARFNLMY